MARVKLTDVIPLTTTDVKESGRKPRGKTKPGQIFHLTEKAWQKKFEAFLKFCGWVDDPAGLSSPNGKLFYCANDQVIEDYESCISEPFDKFIADLWDADDSTMELICERGTTDAIKCDIRIKLC